MTASATPLPAGASLALAASARAGLCLGPARAAPFRGLLFMGVMHMNLLHHSVTGTDWAGVIDNGSEA
jgi:hypothetical protein